MNKTNDINDLKFDPHNLNQGTKRGNKLLKKSLQNYGTGRSILVDKNNVTIAGNKTLEAAKDLGIDNIRIIESDGSDLIVVKRTDLDINDKQAKGLALADNRTAEVNLSWSAENIAQARIDGVQVEDFFSEKELDKLCPTESTNEDLFTEKDEALQKFIETRKELRKHQNDKNEVNFWTCLIFQSWDQKQEFLEHIKHIPCLYGMYIDGQTFAKEYNIPITINPTKPYKNLVEKKLSDMTGINEDEVEYFDPLSSNNDNKE